MLTFIKNYCRYDKRLIKIEQIQKVRVGNNFSIKTKRFNYGDGKRYIGHDSSHGSNLTIEDKDYKGLFYHLMNNNYPKKFALSFLSDINKVKNHDVIIGWIPYEKSIPQPKATPKNFKENDKFVKLLHQVIADNVATIEDLELKAFAKYRKNGWHHISDLRDPSPWGRIPFPEDIIGMVEVRDGKIISETYQPMPTHRIITTKGLFVLSEPFHRKLIEKLNEF
nr:9297_t:CDS:2 [Entrophospora candida]